MTRLHLVLGDQLHRQMSSLVDLDPDRDVVLMVEVMEEATYVRHHKQKIAFLLSAMRHFAQALRSEGIRVDYVRLDESGNTGSFGGEVGRALGRHRPESVVVTEPGEWRVQRMMEGWSEAFGLPVEIRPDTRFLCSRAEFARWAADQPGLRLEAFYRAMRVRLGCLMDGDAPEGGRWNFDRDNRKPLPKGLRPPRLPAVAPDAVTAEVLDLVDSRFPDHFGASLPFAWAVTREGALAALAHFLSASLPFFGDYQDAMRQDEDVLYHSVLSPYLNAGLLVPEEVAAAAERAWRDGTAPLNAVEGFVRQVIGWREYVRGAYWLLGPDYADTNHLGADRPLPWFYWSGGTDMNCLRDCIRATAQHGWAHHIQRLMVLGNFALIAGLRPADVEEWYLVVFVDAYEWVELPNTHGIVLFADGGRVGSKPYAASGAYIDRMSDYCRSCRYDVRRRTGENACPFNHLYWDFLMRNEDRLRANPRLRMPYDALDRMSDGQRADLRRSAARFLASGAMTPDAPADGRDPDPARAGRLL